MNIVERAKRICLSPDTEWPVIAAERTPLGTLLTSYVLPLAALSAIGALVAAVLANLSVVSWLSVLVMSLVMSLAGVVAVSAIIDTLAPTFGAEKSSDHAAKVAAYSPTPAWVGGIAQFLPLVGGLIALVGALYSIYLLYLGLARVMKCPPDKAVAYTVVVALVTMVVAVLIGLVLGMLGFGGGLMFDYTP